MSGYREHSFDPNAGSHGRPLRPFNRWQWLGVGMMVAGAFVMIAALASRIGWLPATKSDWIPAGSSLVVIGSLFVNSRREPGGLTPGTRRKRLIILAAGFAVFAIAIVAVIYLEGAK